MSTGFVSCIRKDIKECFRRNKVTVFAAVALGMALLVFFVTMLIPAFTEAVTDISPELMPGADIIISFIEYAFPSNVLGNYTVFSSDMMAFYMLVVIFLTANLLPSEYKNHKWDCALCKGYKKRDFVLAKTVVYALITATSAFAAFVLYYLLVSMKLTDNMGFKTALNISLLAFFSVFAVTASVILLSAVVKHPMLMAVSVSSIVLFGPDLFGLFSFERFLPTTIIRRIKYAEGLSGGLALPVVVTLVILAVLFFLAADAPAHRARTENGGQY